MATTYPRHWTNLLNASTVVTAAPAVLTDGILVPFDNKPRLWVVSIRHKTTAGNDARTAKGRLYGYRPGEKTAAGVLIPNSEGWADTHDIMSINATADGSDVFTIRGLGVFVALYFRLTDITGIGTEISAAITSYTAI
jgi:hypothetical protein